MRYSKKFNKGEFMTISNIHGTYTNMMPFLIKDRASSKYKGFSYKKNQRLIVSKRGTKSLVIVWDISYNGSYIKTLDTLKEVNFFIKTKANS